MPCELLFIAVAAVGQVPLERIDPEFHEYIVSQARKLDNEDLGLCLLLSEKGWKSQLTRISGSVRRGDSSSKANVKRAYDKAWNDPFIWETPFEVGMVGQVLYGLHVTQVVDGNNMIGTFKSLKTTVWIRGFDTINIMEDTDYYFNKYIFKVAGTKTYTTVLGASKKVFVLEKLFAKDDLPADLFNFGKHYDAFQKEQRLNKNKTETSEYRTWTDSTGKFSVEAAFAGLAGETVTLERKDGSKVRLPLARLHKKDQEYIEELKKKRR